MRLAWTVFLGVFAVGCAAAAQAPSPAPVILVSLDTVRADRLGCYGNSDGLTPSLDKFASEAVLFENAYSQATTTAPSHASLFTSRYPLEQDVGNVKPEITPEMKTLAEVLGVYGWDSAAFVAGGELSPEMGIGRGFGTWQAARNFASLWHTAPLALAWLDGHTGTAPWLLFVHGYDAHVRYLKPTPYGYAHADASYQGLAQEAARGAGPERAATERFIDGRLHHDLQAMSTIASEEVRPRSPAGKARLLADASARGPLPGARDADVTLLRGLYDGAVGYVDAQFGLFMAGLADRHLLDRAVIVVLADHGEQLGEDGIFNHCCGVTDAESHVPLLVRLPGGQGGGRRVAGLVELVDVMPTILELAGAVAPAEIRGHSFAAALRGEPFAGRDAAYTVGGMGMRMLGARAAGGRLVYSGAPLFVPVAPEVIEAAALPGPSFSATAGLDGTAQASLRTGMGAWLRTLHLAGAPADAPLSPALRGALREHGYWEVPK
jgi:arylsulfatase